MTLLVLFTTVCPSENLILKKKEALNDFSAGYFYREQISEGVQKQCNFQTVGKSHNQKKYIST